MQCRPAFNEGDSIVFPLMSQNVYKFFWGHDLYLLITTYIDETGEFPENPRDPYNPRFRQLKNIYRPHPNKFSSQDTEQKWSR